MEELGFLGIKVGLMKEQEVRKATPFPPELHIELSGYGQAAKEDKSKAEALGIKYDPAVFQPPHYTATSIQPIDVIRAWDLGFFEGNTVKYLARAKFKGNEIQDLKKALFYLTERIKDLEKT